jgi:hypothetical protein
MRAIHAHAGDAEHGHTELNGEQSHCDGVRAQASAAHETCLILAQTALNGRVRYFNGRSRVMH